MNILGGIIGRIGLAMADKNSPWGKPSKSGNDGESNGGKPMGDKDDSEGGNDAPPPRGPRNPWLPDGNSTPERPRRKASIEDIFKGKGPEGPRRSGGGGGGPTFHMPTRPGGKSWVPFIVAAVILVWILFSSFHQVGPRQQGIVSTFGRYSHTIDSGISLTAPWPIQKVDITDVTSIRRENIPESGNEKLMLTADQNLVDLSYLIRWNIKDLKQYRYQLAEPEETVREVGEAAMRASVAEHDLDRVLSGSGRAEIEQRVRDRMQDILDAYRSGIAVQGIEIEKTDPPARVVDAFKAVSAAQQAAQTDINRSRAWAQQLLAQAEGDAASFDKVYAEYRLAPEVTRRRMYYETMEKVLANTDKTIIEADGVVPYLPLPETRKRKADITVSAPSTPAKPATTTGGQ
ncbi:protease modulator HflK [Altericroceibacterium indicum]|nr:protease modulator HflK [Altericroceibacterium indicum]